ncbi:MAG: hypothetical protein QNL04_04070 [SAR324 cluster bacterium]|nr:hypothetical protein [SAR324 cluster bacterium]
MSKLVCAVLMFFCFSGPAQAIEFWTQYEFVEEPELGYIEIKMLFFGLPYEQFEKLQLLKKVKITSKHTFTINPGEPFVRTIDFGKDKLTVRLVGRDLDKILILYNGEKKSIYRFSDFLRLRIHPKADLVEFIEYYNDGIRKEDKAVRYEQLSTLKIP